MGFGYTISGQCGSLGMAVFGVLWRNMQQEFVLDKGILEIFKLVSSHSKDKLSLTYIQFLSQSPTCIKSIESFDKPKPFRLSNK